MKRKKENMGRKNMKKENMGRKKLRKYFISLEIKSIWVSDKRVRAHTRTHTYIIIIILIIKSYC